MKLYYILLNFKFFKDKCLLKVNFNMTLRHFRQSNVFGNMHFIQRPAGDEFADKNDFM